MHIHILGICGTFMGGVAILARELGFVVTGSDQNVYPPMSTQLESMGIRLAQYNPDNLEPRPDLVIVGNALSRGNPELEAVLNRGLPYTSGPQWLADKLLSERWVLGVAGTHGKTTTSSMLAWILEKAGMNPGFLIGGIPLNFGQSARLGRTPFFVIEADEYDTAFFDKRSKFIHYRPRTVVINNIEYDHADIFPDLKAIQTQFHHLIRTIPGNGLIVIPRQDPNVHSVLEQGCWSSVETTALRDGVKADWCARLIQPDASLIEVFYHGNSMGTIQWSLAGEHNAANALGAIAAAAHAGVDPSESVSALSQFRGVKRRLELLDQVAGITVYDDFAHHPTAIATTIQGLRARIGRQRLLAILEPRSNSMRMGAHKHALADSLFNADFAFIYIPSDTPWDCAFLKDASDRFRIFNSLKDLADCLLSFAEPGDHLLFMSNGGFGGIQQEIVSELHRILGDSSIDVPRET